MQKGSVALKTVVEGSGSLVGKLNSTIGRTTTSVLKLRELFETTATEFSLYDGTKAKLEDHAKFFQLVCEQASGDRGILVKVCDFFVNMGRV